MPEIRIDLKSFEEFYMEGYRKGLRHGIEHVFLIMHESDIESEFNKMGIQLSDTEDES